MRITPHSLRIYRSCRCCNARCHCQRLFLIWNSCCTNMSYCSTLALLSIFSYTLHSITLSSPACAPGCICGTTRTARTCKTNTSDSTDARTPSRAYSRSTMIIAEFGQALICGSDTAFLLYNYVPLYYNI